MKINLCHTFPTMALIVIASCGSAQNPRRCFDKGPPSIWADRSPYPIQAGTEKTFDELYHGPWKTLVDIGLYGHPRSRRSVGMINAGREVEALLAESIIVHPVRFVAKQNFKVQLPSSGEMKFATVRKGEVFWGLNAVGEGEFTIWWHCTVVGWDSTEPYDVDDDQFRLLGTNEESWVKIRDKKTGLSGWFKDQGDPQLTPARPTTKSPG